MISQAVLEKATARPKPEVVVQSAAQQQIKRDQQELKKEQQKLQDQVEQQRVQQQQQEEKQQQAKQERQNQQRQHEEAKQLEQQAQMKRQEERAQQRLVEQQAKQQMDQKREKQQRDHASQHKKRWKKSHKAAIGSEQVFDPLLHPGSDNKSLIPAANNMFNSSFPNPTGRSSRVDITDLPKDQHGDRGKWKAHRKKQGSEATWDLKKQEVSETHQVQILTHVDAGQQQDQHQAALKAYGKDNNADGSVEKNVTQVAESLSQANGEEGALRASKGGGDQTTNILHSFLLWLR